jgi:hypothetical protein
MTSKNRGRACIAVMACALGAVLSLAPAKAATVTDFVTFSDTATYAAVCCDLDHGYQGTATASGSFKITFDPTQLYLAQSITGVISNLSYSVTDPFFSGSPLTLNPITQFGFDGSGTLALYSNPALGTAIVGTPDITVIITGWASGQASSVWYSQDLYGHTLTSSGVATITELGQGAGPGETPLPAAAWLFGSVLAGSAGFGQWRKRRKATRVSCIKGSPRLGSCGRHAPICKIFEISMFGCS